jgi:nucleotide-binding universal stress UspA family protein
MTTAVAPATTFTEVLIATDFGQEADRALAYAKSVVRGSDGELLLVHVAEPVPHIAIPEGGWVDDPLRAQREIDQTEAAGVALRAEGLHAVALCRFGSVAEEVAEAARNHRANLVVVGTHGRHGLPRVFFGSHAERIADALQIPILIVGPKAPLAASPQWKPKNILCTTSLDRNGAHLVAYAYKLSHEHDAHLEIAYRDVAEEQRDYDDWLEFRKAVKDLLPFEHGAKTAYTRSLPRGAGVREPSPDGRCTRSRLVDPGDPAQVPGMADASSRWHHATALGGSPLSTSGGSEPSFLANTEEITPWLRWFQKRLMTTSFC